jgi:2-amino-4-hydroxy-6-hydroxymethyldihydropteridine diphosphokinase
MRDGMILVALGANLPSPVHGAPVATMTAALAAMEARGLAVVARSPWYETAPVPVSDQPWYANGVAAVNSNLEPAPLLTLLHAIEATFGRVREARNAARILDLDLLAFGDRVEVGWPILPHPRLHERAFVLLPLRDVAPMWRHPVTGADIGSMLAGIGSAQPTRLLAASAGQP